MSCFLCGAVCGSSPAGPCGFEISFCDLCYVLNDEDYLRQVMEEEHTLVCGCMPVEISSSFVVAEAN